MHPEVFFIGFLILLCAGTTFLSFKYSYLNIIKVIVTKLNKISQSAGNFTTFFIKRIFLLLYNLKEKGESTSETLRDKTKIKKISIHTSTHLKPETEKNFGHYLAGLIDADGNFSKVPQLVIVFNELDASLAYYIKSRIGYGNVYKVKSKKAVIFVVGKLEGIKKILQFINGKIRTSSKLDQINNNLLINPHFNDFINFKKNETLDLENYWLSGFSDADASFQIKLINRSDKNKTEVRLNFKIDQKKDYILILIKNLLGGNIGYRFSQDIYSYNSSSFDSARKVIHYFDTYHLLSHKYVDFLKWRKTYCRIMETKDLDSLTLKSLNKIKKTVNSISSNRKYSISTLNHSKYHLNPFWVTGFSDGDSSFTVKFKKRSNFTCKFYLFLK